MSDLVKDILGKMKPEYSAVITGHIADLESQLAKAKEEKPENKDKEKEDDKQEIKEELKTILSHHTGQPIDRIGSDTERDFFMGAKESAEYGIIDHVIYKRPTKELEGEKADAENK